MLFPSLTLFTAWRNTEGVLRKDSSNVSVPVLIVGAENTLYYFIILNSLYNSFLERLNGCNGCHNWNALDTQRIKRMVCVI